MNALAASECWTVSRRLLGPLESMQRDAIVQSLLDYQGSNGRQEEACRLEQSSRRR